MSKDNVITAAEAMAEKFTDQFVAYCKDTGKEINAGHIRAFYNMTVQSVATADASKLEALMNFEPGSGELYKEFYTFIESQSALVDTTIGTSKDLDIAAINVALAHMAAALNGVPGVTFQIVPRDGGLDA